MHALIVAAVSGFLGWALLKNGLASIRSNRQFVQRGLTTTGRIIHIREVSGSEHTFAYPTFQYAVNGITYTYETESTDHRDDFKVGQYVQLYYLPEVPEKCSWRRTPTMGYVNSLSGIIALLISLAYGKDILLLIILE